MIADTTATIAIIAVEITGDTTTIDGTIADTITGEIIAGMTAGATSDATPVTAMRRPSTVRRPQSIMRRPGTFGALAPTCRGTLPTGWFTTTTAIGWRRRAAAITTLT